MGELRKLRFHQPESAMMEYRHELEKSFSENPPSTVNEARERIERETQLKRSPTAVNRFLKNIGMERRKVGSVPAKADTEQQEAFVEQRLNPRLAEMESGKREIFLSMPTDPQASLPALLPLGEGNKAPRSAGGAGARGLKLLIPPSWTIRPQLTTWTLCVPASFLLSVSQSSDWAARRLTK